MQDTIAIVLESPSGLITGWDDAASMLLGYASAEVVDRPLASLLTSPPPQSWHDGRSLPGEGIFRTKDQGEMRLSFGRSHMRDPRGNIIAIVTTLQRKAISQFDRAQLETLVESLGGALFAYSRRDDGGCSFLHASEGVAAMLGLPPSELRANAELAVARIHDEDRPRFREGEAESARTGAVWRCEFRYDAREQGERWLVWNALPASAAPGSPAGAQTSTWTGICCDITQRKLTEADLARSDAQLSSALAAANMGAWIFDADTGKVWGNRQQRELWEAPADAPAWHEKSQCLAKMHEDDEPGAVADLMRALGGEPLRNEFRIVRTDGTIRWIAGRARAEVDPRGPTRRVAGVNIDVTQQKLLTEKALRSQKLEALGTLASGIAHDFNNVLFVIMGNADVALLEAEQGGDTRQMLRALRAATARAADLIQQILSFSRPDQQATQVIKLDSAVNGALTIVRATTPPMIAITAAVDPATPSVCADGSRVGQLIVNLCTNAAHAIGRERAGTIEISISPATLGDEAPAYRCHIPSGDYARLSVSDDGCGIDATILPRVFDPFFTTKRPGEGTGLGLAMVQKIVLAFGAHIAIESAPGQGSRFEVYFPPAGSEAAQSVLAPVQPKRGNAQRVIFVDDEPSLAATGAVLLRALGYDPITFSNPTDALAAFERAPDAYAFVVTDLAMPAMSGLELARRMLALRPSLPVVLMSGNLSPDAHSEAIRIGIRETLVKPAPLLTLSAVLWRLVEPPASGAAQSP